MYILKNALTSINRNKGRNILIGSIILVIACAVSVTLAINNSSSSLIKSYEDKYEVEATIGVNRENMMKDFNPEDRDGSKEDMREKFNSISSISVDDIKNYADSKYVKSYYYTLSLGVNSNLTKAENSSSDGKMDRPKGDFNNNDSSDFTLKGYSSIDSMNDFIEGSYTITDGEVSTDFEGNNCTLTDTNNKLNGQSTTYKNIFLYQSMSGDASVGNSTFTARNSKIITNKGDSFYITNTKAVINLENNTITNNDNSGNFLRAKSDSWGNSGSNGGDVVLNMTKQRAIGNIVIDNISTLDITMKDNSYYEGIINGDNNAKEISLTLDSSSKIKLTGDCYVTSFSNSDSSNSNIDFNGYKLYVNGVSI